MEFEGDSKKLMEETERKAVDGSGMFEIVQTTPKLAAVPSPSRKRKGKEKDLSGSVDTLLKLRQEEKSLRVELDILMKEGDRTVAEATRRQGEGLDLNSSEGKQFFHSMTSYRNNIESVLDSLEDNFQEQNLNLIQYVRNKRCYARLWEGMQKPKLKYQVKMVVQDPQKEDMSSKGFTVDAGSESCSLAADDDGKVEAMDLDNSAVEAKAPGIVSRVMLDTSAMEEQAPVIVSGVMLEMESAPHTNDDVEEQLGLNICMFDSPPDPTPTSKTAAELDEMDKGKSSRQLADEATEMAEEEKNFTIYTSLWESQRGSHGCGSFPDMTTLSSMQLAHLIPGGRQSDRGVVGTTLQVYSIKLSEIKGGLKWPLHVYGVVAVRDAVDHNRNLLFARDNTTCQIVKEDDPYLCLIGPSRAIVLEDPVFVEIQLKLGDSQMSRDRSLISDTRRYYVGSGTISFENCFCTTELSVEAIEDSVQATILGVLVKKGTWPSEYGGIVYCFAPPLGETCHEDQKVVLLDSRSRRMPMGLDGHLDLSRHVVSVELKSRLQFILQTYSSRSGDMGERGTVFFDPKCSSISQQTCYLGSTEVEITVAWSGLVVEKKNIALNGWVLED